MFSIERSQNSVGQKFNRKTKKTWQTNESKNSIVWSKIVTYFFSPALQLLSSVNVPLA